MCPDPDVRREFRVWRSWSFTYSRWGKRHAVAFGRPYRRRQIIAWGATSRAEVER